MIPIVLQALAATFALTASLILVFGTKRLRFDRRLRGRQYGFIIGYFVVFLVYPHPLTMSANAMFFIDVLVALTVAVASRVAYYVIFRNEELS